MAANVHFLDPTADPQWDEAITSLSGSNIFHTACWARTLRDSYRYQSLYGVWEEKGKLLCVVPLMEVDSFLTGRRGVSLPFTDFCPIITDGNISTKEMLESLIQLGKSRQWKTLELRYSESIPKDGDIIPYLVHELDLRPGEEALFRDFRDSTRRNIRKAVKLGVKIIEDNSSSGLKEFCRLNDMTRRNHGLPPQPPKFFANLHKNIILAGNGRILLASYEDVVISAAVYLSFNGKVVYKYGASNNSYQQLRANNLLMWEAIKRYAGEGFNSFHFGRTNSEHSGLLQFKRGWGAEEKGLQYIKVNLIDGSSIPTKSLVTGFHNRLFSHLPLPVLGMIGRVLYRHMG